MTELPMSNGYREYFKALEDGVNELYEIAKQARAKGLDTVMEPEPQITHDIAERIEKLIGPEGIGDRMRELDGMDRREMAFKVAEEIALGRFGNLEKLEAADQAIRTALAIMTEGVTIAPIEGIPEIRIKQNPDRSSYLAVYFAGPIRPAGGTAQALTLVVADFVRRKLGMSRYQPSREAIDRFIEEVRLYEGSVRRFQYHVTDEDLELALSNLTVEATGVSTDPYEVSNFRDIPGIETNRVRGGPLIVVVDGIVGRAGKLKGHCDKLGLEGWSWLSKIGHSNDEDAKPTASFMEEVIVGRPVFSFPGRTGGFRLRYGRARNTGLAAVGVHPATKIILNRFLTTGVQLRIELPGKSAVVMPVDSIEPPVVKLRDGSVRRVESAEEAIQLEGSVEIILSLGDVLINAGDFIQSNKSLLRAGYDENQWVQDLRKALKNEGLEAVTKRTDITKDRLETLTHPTNVPTVTEALTLAEDGVPLHPRYNYNWTHVSGDALRMLRKNLVDSWHASGPYEVELNAQDKETLERLLVPHTVSDGRVNLDEAAPVLERCLALGQLYVEEEEGDPLETVRALSGLDIRDRASVYVGARMGRPEKAKERKMSPYVHGLFPVGNAGGPQRNLLKVKKGTPTSVQLANRRCPRCGALCFSAICSECGESTVVKYRCPRCGRSLEMDSCPACRVKAVGDHTVDIDIRGVFDAVWKRIGGQLPGRVKCVKGLMNRNRVPEPLEKGLLRARYDLSVFKDGTLRFDLTDVPLTHFSPAEVSVSFERLRELGYTVDMRGVPLTSGDQMLELKVQDVIIPEDCGDYLVKASRFIDDLLELHYGLERYYRIKDRMGVVGQLVHGLAPHTSATIIGRVIGYTTTRNCYAHPLWHAAKRRNCDGDEDAIMLGLDPLLNFSREFLPEQSGGLMDAPLYVTPVLNPSEVDGEAHNVDVMPSYPPEFYRMCGRGASPSDYGPLIDTIGSRLGTEAQFQGFSYTEECSNINLCSHLGAYNTLKTMLEKLESQLELSERIFAVDAEEVAQKVLTSHFLKDIVGNLRAFTRQRFRCIKCNRKYRRPPLKGICVRCGGNLAMTVHKGGIEKYLNPALDLVKRYELDEYYADRLGLVKDEIFSLFPEEEKQVEPEDKQFSLTDFMRKDRA
ncbi:MAG: DNA polymerase II large subunit [Candidatus Bathyarchaeota archaeon]|nr:MAG: DNA polymerase II large subunit [Candidatus Bathyarchaeota archaeon]